MLSCARLAKVLGGILAVWGAAGVILVSAQGRLDGRFGKGQIPQPKLPDLHVDGTIEDLRPGMIQVLSANSAQSWLLRILPQARIQATGKATPEFLGPGHCIAFVAEVDVRRARVEQPVTKLVVFSPSPELPLGAAEDQGLGLSHFKEKKKRDRAKQPVAPGFGPGAGFGPGQGFGPGMQPGPGFGPGAGPGFGPGVDAGPGLGGGEPRSSGRRAKAGPLGPGGKGAPASQSLEVRGQITSFKAGKAALQVPNAPFRGALKIEIAENAEIDVQLSGPAAFSLAQKGDKVRARGQQLGEQVGQIDDLEITLSETVGAAQAKKRPAPKAERTPRSKRSAEPEEKAPAGEPARPKDTKKDEG